MAIKRSGTLNACVCNYSSSPTLNLLHHNNPCSGPCLFHNNHTLLLPPPYQKCYFTPTILWYIMFPFSFYEPQLLSKLKDVQVFLCVAAPFGTPVDTNPATVQALVNGKDIIMPQKGKVCPKVTQNPKCHHMFMSPVLYYGTPTKPWTRA